MRPGAATVVDLAAYLGVTPRRVRQLVKARGIEPVGTRWKAKLYDPNRVITAALQQHFGPKSSDERMTGMAQVWKTQGSALTVDVFTTPEYGAVDVEVSDETAARWLAAADAWSRASAEIEQAWRAREFNGERR